MTPQSLLAEAAQRGIELFADGQTIRYRGPKTAVADLRPKLAAHKGELLALLRAKHYRTTTDKALALLKQLRCYTLPAGRMPVVTRLAQRLADAMVQWENGEPVSDLPDDPTVILRSLQGFERELIALGGAPDRELAEAAAIVEAVFPCSRLVEVRKLR
ncbi:MAG: hypothetical protein ACLQDV_07960 [Candidatus Binataceae bacterium]